MDRGHRIERFREQWWTIDPPALNFAPRRIGFAGDFYYLGEHYVTSGLPFSEANTPVVEADVYWTGVVTGAAGEVNWKFTQGVDLTVSLNTYKINISTILDGELEAILVPVATPYQWSADRAVFVVQSISIINPSFDMYANQTIATPNYWQVRNGVWP